uniref:Malate dehydrogenase n=1 Tax=Gasterosteus aculeatus aculeatus TaxID=481459 RepID=G3NH26_GASAC
MSNTRSSNSLHNASRATRPTAARWTQPLPSADFLYCVRWCESRSRSSRRSSRSSRRSANMTRCLISKSEVQGFVERCMTSVGTQPHHARSLAEVLVEGDHRGHYSHGLNRMDMYVKDVQTGICAKDGEPVVEKESAATALVDGKNLLGPVVGNFCMNLAIKKAKEAGIGWVVAHGSNHYGIAGYYAMQALKENMIGMSFTNTSPLVVPTRGKECTLGTNPISVAAPAKDGDSFVLDMATSAVALGKVELHERRGDTIPEGWGCDAQGKLTTNPKEVLSGGGLVPIGGSEATGGYKGFGLGMMVEVFCGILAGAQYSKHVRTWKVTDRVANLGQCFVAINPENFAPGFSDRMSDLLSIHRGMEPADSASPVLTAGDPERINMKKCEEMGGIPYHINVINYMVGGAKGTAWNVHRGVLFIAHLKELRVCTFLQIHLITLIMSATKPFLNKAHFPKSNCSFQKKAFAIQLH